MCVGEFMRDNTDQPAKEIMDTSYMDNQGSQLTWHTPVGVAAWNGKYLPLIQIATFTRPIRTGTSTRGPITAANATPESIPKTATATAMASSKLFDAAVKLRVVDCS